jgi:hypothetical protein
MERVKEPGAIMLMPSQILYLTDHTGDELSVGNRSGNPSQEELPDLPLDDDGGDSTLLQHRIKTNKNEDSVVKRTVRLDAEESAVPGLKKEPILPSKEPAPVVGVIFSMPNSTSPQVLGTTETMMSEVETDLEAFQLSTNTKSQRQEQYQDTNQIDRPGSLLDGAGRAMISSSTHQATPGAYRMGITDANNPINLGILEENSSSNEHTEYGDGERQAVITAHLVDDAGRASVHLDRIQQEAQDEAMRQILEHTVVGNAHRITDSDNRLKKILAAVVLVITAVVVGVLVGTRDGDDGDSDMPKNNVCEGAESLPMGVTNGTIQGFTFTSDQVPCQDIQNTGAGV